jgi:hypothetical protein
MLPGVLIAPGCEHAPNESDKERRTMIRTTAILCASVALLSASAAQAQQIDVQRNGSTIINGVAYPAPGQALIMPDMPDFLAAFTITRSKLNAVANLTEQSVVKVVVVDPISDANSEAIASARAEHQQGITKLQMAIGANINLSDDLALRDVAVSTIVAADLSSSGDLILYALA